MSSFSFSFSLCLSSDYTGLLLKRKPVAFVLRRLLPLSSRSRFSAIVYKYNKHNEIIYYLSNRRLSYWANKRQTRCTFLHRLTLFLQGLARVPHLRSSEHNTLFPLQGHPRVPSTYLRVLHELLHLQWLAYIKQSYSWLINKLKILE
jgi:hypothetical protein